MTSGVGFEERDQSFSIPLNVGGRICMAGPCKNGPIGSYENIDSEDAFLRMYGGHYNRSNFPTICIEALRGGCKLAVSRVVHATDPDDASTVISAPATVTVKDKNPAASGGYLESATGPWFMDNGTTFTIDDNGVPTATATLVAVAATVESTVDDTWDFTGGKTLEVKVNRGPTQVLTIPAGAVPGATTAQEVVDSVNSQLIGGWAEKIGIGPNYGVKLWTDRKGTGAYIQIVGGTANALLIMPTAEQQGSGDVADHTAVTPAEINSLVSTLLGYGTSWTVTVTGSTTIRFTQVTTGVGAYIGFDAPSSGATILGFTVGAGGDAYGIDAAEADTIKFDGKYHGTIFAGLSFTIGDDPTDPNNWTLTIPVSSIVENLEYYEGLSMDVSSDRYFMTYINTRSKVLVLTDLFSATPSPNNRPKNGTYLLVGGNDGLTGLVGTDFVGTVNSKLGVHAFDGIGGVGAPMDILAPTIHEDTASGGVTASESIDQWCKDRRDMVFHQIPPNPTDSVDTVKFRNGTAPYTHTKFNSSYSSILFGKGEIDGPAGRQYVNAGAAYPYVLSYTDTGNGKKFEDIGQWFAPCGENRGRTRFFKNSPSIGDRDPLRGTLEDAQINYLADMGRGSVVWNQSTLLVPFSALRDLNVRRLMIYVERGGVAVLRMENWEPNDPQMWREAVRQMERFLQPVKDARGFYDFRVYGDQDADEVKAEQLKVNTVEGIDQGIYKMKVFVKPTRAAKEIQLIFIITPTGVDFEEIL